MNIALWISQILLAITMAAGAVMKFLPIETMAPTMPWVGEVSEIWVRLLGIVDLLGAVGLVLPMLLNIKPKLTVWAAIGTLVLMVAAIAFHLSRGEANVIGFNIFVLLLTTFVAWGRS